MSVWESIEALRNFAYRSDHARVFRDRAKWFHKMSKPNYCLWCIPAGHIPTVAAGRARLAHYQSHGATPYSFWFTEYFPQPRDEGVCVVKTPKGNPQNKNGWQLPAVLEPTLEKPSLR